MSRWSSSAFQQSTSVVMGPRVREDDDGVFATLRLYLREPVIQCIARAAHGADRVLFAAGIEQFAQAADVHVYGALVDIDVAAPDAVEQLLATEDAAGMLQEKLQQAILCRAEIDRSARTRDAAFFAVEFDVAIGQDGGEALGTCPPQQALHPREKFRHRERLDDVIVGTGRQPPHPLALLAACGEPDDR